MIRVPVFLLPAVLLGLIVAPRSLGFLLQGGANHIPFNYEDHGGRPRCGVGSSPRHGLQAHRPQEDAAISRRGVLSLLPLPLLTAFYPGKSHAMGWLTEDPASGSSAAANLPEDVLASGIVTVAKGADLDR
jgi:hypothetical protein